MIGTSLVYSEVAARQIQTMRSSTGRWAPCVLQPLSQKGGQDGLKRKGAVGLDRVPGQNYTALRTCVSLTAEI